jgi:hypothetical protein
VLFLTFFKSLLSLSQTLHSTLSLEMFPPSQYIISLWKGGTTGNRIKTRRPTRRLRSAAPFVWLGVEGGQADEQWDLDGGDGIDERCSVTAWRSRGVQGSWKQLVVKGRLGGGGEVVRVSILLSVSAGTRWPRC